MKSSKQIAGLGIITAIAASLCCIAPIVALIGGASGLASSFPWIEPAKPFLIGFTVLSLGFAWYQNLKPQKEVDCNCEPEERKGFMESRTFLGIITLFAILMLSVPYYSHVFYSISGSTVELNTNRKSEFSIEGMTCASCEQHVSYEILKLKGIGELIVSYDDGNAIVEFDENQTSPQSIENAINSTGYVVTEILDLQ